MIPRQLILLFYSALLSTTSYSQNQDSRIIVEGIIYNRQTQKPVPYANIYLRIAQRGISASESGEFSIVVENHRPDTLVFSAIGYTTLEISSLSVDTLPKTIYLEETLTELSTVTVSASRAVDIIRQAMRNREKTYATQPHKLTGIYRIADREDGAYVRLAEAAIDIYDDDFMKKDSRIVDYVAVRHSKDFRTFTWKMDKLNSRTVEELLKPDLIKRPTRATHQNGFEKGFFYSFEGYSTLDNKEIYIISAKKNPAYEWPNYDATFYVRSEDLAIVRVDRDYTIPRPNWAKEQGVKTRTSTDQLILKYKEKDGRLYLDYFLWTLKGEVVDEKSKNKVINFERIEELNINEVSFAKAPKVRSAWDRDIYKMTEQYNRSVWDAFLGSGTKLFKDVSKELSEKENLEAQFVTSSASNNSSYDPHTKIKANDLKEDFKILESSIKEAHPAVYRYTSEERINQLFDSANNLLTKGMREKEFYQLTQRVVADIHCGHTMVKPSLDYSNFVKYRKIFLPVRTSYINNQLIVSNNWPEGILTRGDEIVSVNGRSIQEIAKTLMPLIEADGYGVTFKEKRFGQNFSELYNAYFEGGDTFTIAVKTNGGEVVEKKIPGISLFDLQQLNVMNSENRFTLIKPSIGILKVGSFIDYPEIHFKSWVRKAFAAIAHDSIEHLVIDLRNNGGGRDDYALYLYSFLAKSSFSYHTSLHAATNNLSFLSYTDQDNSLNEILQKITTKDSLDKFVLRSSHPTLGEHRPSQPIYRGKVYFLINGGTFSAASDFAAICRQNQVGIFVGEETGGAAIGNTSNGEVILTLPNSKIRIQIPLFMITNAVSNTMPGRGVVPDHYVGYTAEDIKAMSDKDLEFVLNIIR